MIWLVKGNMSHQIISCNIYDNKDKGTHELWVTRPGGKNLKISESKNRDVVSEIKDAIDYAVEKGIPILRLT